MSLAAAIQELHDKCAVYTSPIVSARMLDAIGWTENRRLDQCVLLEPCVGEAAILLEGIRRLLQSFRRYGMPLTETALLPTIRGFELHPGAAETAKRNIRKLLILEGLDWTTASKLADSWVTLADFLLVTPEAATHVVANPPYVRWGKLPAELAAKYRKFLPALATRGDLAVAFLHRMQAWAKKEGTIVALVSDRWMFTQYGKPFMDDSLARGWCLEVVEERPTAPFAQQVGAYASIVRFTQAHGKEPGLAFESRALARKHHSELLSRFGSLTDSGCVLRVGPALGAGTTFQIAENDLKSLEGELVRTFVDKSDLAAPVLYEAEKRIVVPYDRRGRQINLNEWPGFDAWAQRHEKELRSRKKFADSDHFWRTIDAIPAIWDSSPKLLIPELSKNPFAVLDRSGSIPAHSIYALWTNDWPIETLQRVLNSGLLVLTSVAEAPRVQNGWMRFYKRFIARTPLPRWNDLSHGERADLQGSESDFDRVFSELFGFVPGSPPIG